MSRLLNAIKMHAGNMDNSGASPRWGLVQSVDTTSMTVKVLIQPENVLSGFLPILSPMAGNGWGIVHPPAINQPVLLLPDAGSDNSYVVMGGTWSTSGMPPSGAQVGELWMVHSTGTTMRLTNEGNVWVFGKNQANIVAEGSATMSAPDLFFQADNEITMLSAKTTHIGDITVMGKVTANQFITTTTPLPAPLPVIPPLVPAPDPSAPIG